MRLFVLTYISITVCQAWWYFLLIFHLCRAIFKNHHILNSIFYSKKNSLTVILVGLFFWVIGWKNLELSWKNPLLYLAGLASLFIIAIIWIINVSIHHFLMNRLAARYSFRQRFLFMITINLVISFLTLFILISLVGWFFIGDGTQNFQLHLSTILFIVLLINGLVYYYQENQRTSQKSSLGPTKQAEQKLSIPVGRGQRMVARDEIALAMLHQSAVRIYLHNGTSFSCLLTLKDLQAEHLNTTDFYRVNRTCILHRKAISNFRITSNHHLAIAVSPAVESEIMVNKNKVHSFKSWLAES